MKSVGKYETPDQMHGRLLESAHLSGYTGERACAELKWLLRQERWKSVGPGYDDINDFLATIDLSEFRLLREHRKDIVRQLAAIEAGQRAIGRALGVSSETVARDMGVRATNVAATTGEIVEIEQEPAKSLDISATKVAPRVRPYYSEAGITIYHGDCREILPELERGLMVTDPPYNVGYHYNEYDDALDANEYQRLLGQVLYMPLVFIHYPESLYAVEQKFLRAPDKVVAWVYHAHTPRKWRAVAWFGVAPDLSLVKQPYKNPTDKRIREKLLDGSAGADLYDWWHIEQVKNVSVEKTEHPCQIPDAVMMRALHVTPHAGPIIDPFCGSGTTLLAAQRLGRAAIGIDCSEEYCEIAANRLRQPAFSFVSA